jgi:hypothetical protein
MRTAVGMPRGASRERPTIHRSAVPGAMPSCPFGAPVEPAQVVAASREGAVAEEALA